MYTIEIPKLRKNQLAIVLHHPESVGHYSAFAEHVIVIKAGNWLDRAEAKFGAPVRLYDDGTAFLGLGAYSRPINGQWEAFTPKQLADKNESVRVAPLLEALKNLLPLAVTNAGSLTRPNREYIASARAAIAKAEGRE